MRRNLCYVSESTIVINIDYIYHQISGLSHLVDSCVVCQNSREIRTDWSRIRHDNRIGDSQISECWLIRNVGPKYTRAMGRFIREKVIFSRAVKEMVGNHSAPWISNTRITMII